MQGGGYMQKDEGESRYTVHWLFVERMIFGIALAFLYCPFLKKISDQ